MVVRKFESSDLLFDDRQVQRLSIVKSEKSLIHGKDSEIKGPDPRPSWVMPHIQRIGLVTQLEVLTKFSSKQTRDNRCCSC